MSWSVCINHLHADCEDHSVCLSYDGADAPTAESDRERVLGKACTCMSWSFCINHLQIVKIAVPVYRMMAQMLQQQRVILGKTLSVYTHLQIVKTAVAVYRMMATAESDGNRILGKTLSVYTCHGVFA